MPRRFLILAVVLVLPALTLASCDSPLSDTVTLYPAACANHVEIIPRQKRSHEADLASRHGCEIVPFERKTYRVNLARGEIYYVFNTFPLRLLDCAIMDNENWSCRDPEDGGRYAVLDGLRAYSQLDVEQASRFNYTLVFYLRGWQWWSLKLLGMFRSTVHAPWLIPAQNPVIS